MLGPSRISRPLTGQAGCLLAALVAGLPCLAGCRESAAILPGDVRQYTVPREQRPPGGETATALPRTASPRTADSPGGLRLRYEVPAGWSDRGGGGLRLATLALGDPGDGNEVTVIPAAGTLDDNVARWQGQLEPEQEASAAAAAVRAALEAAETIDVDGATATVVMLLDRKARDRSARVRAATSDTDESETGQAILAAMIPLDDTAALFVKYKGTAAGARRERDRFVEFVRSIRWK